MNRVAASARTIVIGDVHGCLDELRRLLAAVDVRPSTDQVVLVGDLVAKGPDSQGVVQACREQRFLAVLGNHDAKVLSLRSSHATAAEKPEKQPEKEKERRPSPSHERVAASLGERDWAYLANLPLSLRLATPPETVVVHAGLVPGVAIERQDRACLLNLRSITTEGAPSKRVDGGAPWASVWTGPEHVVFGHDAVRGLQRYEKATGLDTGCVYGRELTALILPERRLISVAARRAYAPMKP